MLRVPESKSKLIEHQIEKPIKKSSSPTEQKLF